MARRPAPLWLPLAKDLRSEGRLLREIAEACHTTPGNVDYWLNHEIRRERKSPATFVYFLQADWGGPIKIGFGTASRLIALKSASPDDLVIRHRIPCETKDEAARLERMLHAKYDGLRLRGEWFLPNQELAAEAQARLNRNRESVEPAYPAEDTTLTARILREAHQKGYERGWQAGYGEGWDNALERNGPHSAPHLRAL